MSTYAVHHRTAYAYAAPVALSHHLLHLEPRPTWRQRLQAHALDIQPKPNWTDRRHDAFGNPARAITFDREHSHLVVEARSTIEVMPPTLPSPASTSPWERVVRLCGVGASPAALDAARFAFPSPFTPITDDVETFALASFAGERPVLDAVLDLNHRIHSEFAFDANATTIATPVDEVLRLRRGVCQDFAHLMLAALRVVGLPARYVSGYLLTRPPPGEPRLQGADASHAWVSVWLPDHGWIDVDPTNDLMPKDEHVTLAWGRDYGDVSPVAGVVYGGGAHSLVATVDVTPVQPEGFV